MQLFCNNDEIYCLLLFVIVYCLLFITVCSFSSEYLSKLDSSLHYPGMIGVPTEFMPCIINTYICWVSEYKDDMFLRVNKNKGENFSDADKKMSDQVMTLWTNFAKSGSVNANQSDSTSQYRSTTTSQSDLTSQSRSTTARQSDLTSQSRSTTARQSDLTSQSGLISDSK